MWWCDNSDEDDPVGDEDDTIHLEEQHELESIPEIFLDVLDLCSRLPQVGVHPGCEGLAGGRNTGGKYSVEVRFGNWTSSMEVWEYRE